MLYFFKKMTQYNMEVAKAASLDGIERNFHDMKNNTKKRIVSFLLLSLTVSLLCLPILCFNSFAESNTVSISPAFGGWENWTGSPNNPNPGSQPGVTQLLVGISGENGEFPAALNTTDIIYTLTFDWLEGEESKTKTINLKPATVADVYKLVRFETVMADGENQFIPYKNQAYTLTLSVTTAEGVTYTGKSGEYAFGVPMFPVVNGIVDESYLYEKPAGKYPYTLNISQYHSGTVEVDGVEMYKSDWEIWNEQQMLIMLVSKSDIYDLADISSGTAVGLKFNGEEEITVALDSTVDMGSKLLLRIPTEKVFTPKDGTVYDIQLTVYKNIDGENVVAYTGMGEDFTANGVTVAPETGDGAMIFIAIAVISVMMMVYILMPKSRKNIIG